MCFLSGAALLWFLFVLAMAMHDTGHPTELLFDVNHDLLPELENLTCVGGSTVSTKGSAVSKDCSVSADGGRQYHHCVYCWLQHVFNHWLKDADLLSTIRREHERVDTEDATSSLASSHF